MDSQTYKKYNVQSDSPRSSLFSPEIETESKDCTVKFNYIHPTWRMGAG